ncbi:hypothetical protein M4951_12025 [Blastopirellula sp. J2-11]|uniref:hypothetical protein n=1 Tax=Blastopirellula sp. J2-11 TaxID=2943192 RepID=UPI0021C7A300|nr:hypothetical protein [Blastopirellula sp. J2-11]UUO09015.1 hypothetical protein M4951_12025 [Blastopirellula sp. J2-11]
MSLSHAACCLFVPLLLVAGCSAPNAPSQSPQELSFREQLRQVIAGESDTIEVTERVVSPAELQLLSRATKLQRIRLDQTPLDDPAAAVLGALPDLQFVNLPQAKITDAGLAEIAKLPQLTQLRIGSPHITDAGIAALRDNPSLRFLHLLQTPLTDAALEHIAEINSLESFYLDQTDITEPGLAKLIEQRPQLHVHFDDAHLPGQEH